MTQQHKEHTMDKQESTVEMFLGALCVFALPVALMFLSEMFA
jgi:hypothetical protein